MSDKPIPQLKRLSELVDQVDDKIAVKKDPDLPYVGLEHIGQRNAHLLGWAPSETSVSVNSVFQEGDVLFGKLRPNLRKCVSAPFSGYCSTDILVLRARNGNDAKFAARVFQTDAVGAEAERTSVGTKMPRTSWKSLSQFLVSVPEPKEQSKIAEILDTLDAAIQETEAVVAKLKAMKQGLLHDLLTRGIDANGDLRPPHAEAPHLYKETPLGWLPKEWEVAKLGDAAESIIDGPFGSNLKTEHYVETPGVRVVRLQNIQAGYFDDTERAFITDRHAGKLARNEVVSGDVLIASLGDDGHPVGRACRYPENLPKAINKADCFRFRGRSICRNGYAMLFLNGDTARRQARGFEQGVTMKRINLGNLRKMLVSLPKPNEQTEIEERAAAIDATYEASLSELAKLRLQKSGLMDDLLTGRVPVTPLLEGEAAHGA
jgi:type I restriction enzyme S subunit